MQNTFRIENWIFLRKHGGKRPTSERETRILSNTTIDLRL
jgi:hypothetical protein